MIEQRAKTLKSSTQKPHDQDFEDFITVDYCSEFSFTDINNWTCIEDFNPETNLTFRLGMQQGKFYLINEEGFLDEINQKERKENPSFFEKNGSTYLECMK